MAKRPITPKGFEKLKEELRELKKLRPELSKAIETARAHGDISENAEYEAAKERSGMVEAKIRDLESRIASVEVIDPSKINSTDKVVFGLSVELLDLDNDSTVVYTLVGRDEGDPKNGLISIDTPVGRALLGKKVDDIVEVKLPKGVKEYQVLRIFLDQS